MTDAVRKSLKAADLNDVRMFVAIAEAQTLTAAARRLHVPTSTVSRALTRLERGLGVTLVHRNARGFVMTDVGKGYLNACRKALRALDEGEDWIEAQQSQPGGVLKVSYPVTFARDVLAPLLGEFLIRCPHLRVQIETYASGCDLMPSDDVDVFFKVRRPNDSSRRIRSYPGHALGLHASTKYVQAHGSPATPSQLAGHCCIGAGSWRLTRDTRIETPQLEFAVETFDPDIHLTLILSGLGIGRLPLWMVHRPDIREQLVVVLPEWRLDPLSMCALFFGPKGQTPKVQALLDFLHEYIGTRKDPRLRLKWNRDLFPHYLGANPKITGRPAATPRPSES